MQQKETAIKNNILDWLKYKNVFCWLTNTAGNFNKFSNSYYKNPRLLRGVADIVGITNSGRFFCIETKAGKNKQSSEQKDFELKILQNNGVYLLAYSLEDLIDKFEKICKL
ncbi:MAG: hypothetical protein A3F67_04195 [Verrucomicrobia bacterium RIFCSPHIGHO2_12_FULL_41_10]|nr:MAG: hypothetical protein A3F67_04195 [Verrucomicrobia bacterium RIFCSPHIGHO2_12_FULL_41_10]HLB57751.1 hypothetical protein [Gammaproteobacteria bacterium]